MKRVFLFLMIMIGAITITACLPVNSAESKKNERNGGAESANTKQDNDGSSSSSSNNDATVEPSPAEAVNSATEHPNDPESPLPPRRTKIIPPKQDNFVCPEPNLPCHHPDKEFDEWELSFRLPEKIVAYKHYQSAPFYAVILKKLPDGCGDLDVDPFVEKDRLKIQSEFPSRKVFAENICANLSAVGYDFEGKKDKNGIRAGYTDYIAVYAGATEDEARQILQLAQKGYPQAELKLMTVDYELIVM